MSLKHHSWLALRSLLAIMLALVVLVLINLGGGALADLMGFPGGGEGRLAWDLGCFFLAGLLAVWTAVRLASRAPLVHAAVVFGLILAMDVVGVAQLGSDWPHWFSAGILLTLPVQAFLGARWARRASKSA